EAAEAEQAFRAAARARATAVDARRRLVFLLVLEQRVDEAQIVLRALYAQARDMRDLITLVSLDTVEFDARDLRPELDRFLARTPGDPWLRRARGLNLLRLGKPVEARADLAAAAAAIENDPGGRLALAECAVLLGECDSVGPALGLLPDRPE